LSITRLLSSNAQVKLLFATIPNLKDRFINVGGGEPFPSNLPIIVQREGRAGPVIGHAYDYLLRAYVQRINGIHQEREGDHLSAAIAVNILDSKHIHEAYMGIVERRNAYISGRSELTIEVITDAVILGQLESYYRSGYADIPNILRTSEEDINDLHQLARATEAHSEHFIARESLVCNPQFGEAVTRLVDGADGDLIIDGMLIDIKTESDYRWKIGHLRQLVTYWVLSRLTPEFVPEIKHLAIWNPRYSRLVYIELEVLRHVIDMTAFISTFVDIITTDHFEGSEHLSPGLRQRCSQIVRETWSAITNTMD